MRGQAADISTLAGRLVVGIDGPALSAAERQWLRTYRPAGTILFARNVSSAPQLTALCREVRDLLGAGAEVVADHEGGPVSVLAAALGRPPAPYGLGWLDDPDLTRQVHRDTGAAMSAVGIKRVLAPCADVLVETRNPVIGSRAFGGEVPLVARHVAAAVSGLHEGGVACCLKHWPGHGGTVQDSHDGPVKPGRGGLDLPFLAGLQAGADALLVGHLPRSQGQTAATVPATLDLDALTAARCLLPGVVPRLFADDVTMGALRPADGGRGLLDPAELPLSWFGPLVEAGCDLLLCRGIPWAALPLGSGGADRPLMATPFSTPAGSNASSPRSGGGEVQLSLPAADWPASYAETRRRLAATSRQGSRSRPPKLPSWLLWWDATWEDRWGDASALYAVLERHGLPWQRFGPGGEVQEAKPPHAGMSQAALDSPCAFLLVTCHRPLDSGPLSQALARQRLAGGGRVLVMGHPSLSREVTALVPEAWSVDPLFEIGPEDLQTWLAIQGFAMNS